MHFTSWPSLLWRTPRTSLTFEQRFSDAIELNATVQAAFKNYGTFMNQARELVIEADKKLVVGSSRVSGNITFIADRDREFIFQCVAAAGLKRFAPRYHGLLRVHVQPCSRTSGHPYLPDNRRNGRICLHGMRYQLHEDAGLDDADVPELPVFASQRELFWKELKQPRPSAGRDFEELCDETTFRCILILFILESPFLTSFQLCARRLQTSWTHGFP